MRTVKGLLPTGISTPASVVALLIGLVVLAACASDGRDLAEPQQWQTTTTRPAPPTSALDEEISPSGVVLSSPDFAPGADIPESARCSGANVFPQLDWTPVPSDTVELALTLSDQTNPEEPVLLWLMGGIDPSMTTLESGTLPTGAFETLNDYGNPGYGTPCLESFVDGRRDLQFRLYLLPRSSDLAAGDPGNDAWSTLRGAAVESATLLARIDSSTS